MLVDLRAKGITGKGSRGCAGRCPHDHQQNAIPNDPEKPMVTSGIRIGSPACTRGLRKKKRHDGQPDR